MQFNNNTNDNAYNTQTQLYLEFLGYLTNGGFVKGNQQTQNPNEIVYDQFTWGSYFNPIKIAVVVSNYNFNITNNLVTALNTNAKWIQQNYKVQMNFDFFYVPGSFEIPFMTRQCVQNKYDVVITLGCLIKGETMHFDVLSSAIANGIMEINVDQNNCNTPIIYGIINALDIPQALKRSNLNDLNNNVGYTSLNAALMQFIANKTIKDPQVKQQYQLFIEYKKTHTK